MAAKKKPMTAAQKRLRAEVRADLRERGVIPPKKKPLNYKKFIEETRKQWNSSKAGGYGALLEAFGWVMSDVPPTLECVGAAKVLRCAMEIDRFMAELKEQGRVSYTPGELYERLKPILEA